MDLHLDPLGNQDVQRVLLWSRARERYPELRRDVLRECCEAAWEVAHEGSGAGGPARLFERALVQVVWARRGGRGPLPLAELVDRTIPKAVLEPFHSGPARPRSSS